jgi:hypothetical protein
MAMARLNSSAQAKLLMCESIPQLDDENGLRVHSAKLGVTLYFVNIPEISLYKRSLDIVYKRPGEILGLVGSLPCKKALEQTGGFFTSPTFQPHTLKPYLRLRVPRAFRMLEPVVVIKGLCPE